MTAENEWRVTMNKQWAESLGGPVIPLYAALSQQPAVPPGWKLVPIEPTPEMLDAAGDVETHRDDYGHPFYMSWGEARSAWEGMLAAAPAPGTVAAPMQDSSKEGGAV